MVAAWRMTGSSLVLEETALSSAAAAGPPSFARAITAAQADDRQEEAVAVADDVDERADGALIVQHRQGTDGFGAGLGHGVTAECEQRLNGADVAKLAERSAAAARTTL